MAKKYIVLHGNAGQYGQDAIITDKEAGDSLDFWLGAGAIREATSEEAKAGNPGELGSEARSVSEATGAMDTKAIEAKRAEGPNEDDHPTTATEADAQQRKAAGK